MRLASVAGIPLPPRVQACCPCSAPLRGAVGCASCRKAASAPQAQNVCGSLRSCAACPAAEAARLLQKLDDARAESHISVPDGPLMEEKWDELLYESEVDVTADRVDKDDRDYAEHRK